MYNKELMLFGNRTYCRKILCVFNGYEKNAPIVAIDYLSAMPQDMDDYFALRERVNLKIIDILTQQNLQLLLQIPKL